MEKLDAVPSKQDSPPAPPAKQRPLSFLAKYWDLAGVLLLMLASMPAQWLAPRIVTFVPNLGLIDDNWHLDASFKALRGIWVGRDVAFTHGPIFQWLSSLPARSIPLSMGGLYATWNTVPLWCAFLFLYLTLRLLMPEQPAWKRFILLLLLSSFWEVSLRTSVPALLFAVFLRGWYQVREGRARGYILGIVGALLCAIAFLIAGDTGIYGTAAWFAVLLGIALETRKERFAGKLLSTLAAFLLASFVIAIAINSLMASPWNFKFWRDSLAQVAAYRWATPAAMTAEGEVHLLGALLMGTAVFLVRARTRKTKVAVTQRTAFLLGGYLFALAMLQSALVRSDIGHVIIGESAMVLFVSMILFALAGRASAVGVLAVIAGCVLFSRPIFRPSSLTRVVSQLRNPVTECPPGYSEFDRACYQEALTPQMLSAASTFLQSHSGPDDSIFVFPYQTMLGLASHRSVAGGLMQAYTASGPYLSQLEIAGLEHENVPAALYFPDADLSHWRRADVARWSRNYLSIPVDGIPNFTRTPEVWFWMLRHYRSEQELTPGVVGLQRDDSRATRISMQVQPLALPARTYAIDKRVSTIDLGSPVWPSGFDFIRLRLTVRYPVWWKLRKPERLQLEIIRADGTRDFQWMVVPPNAVTEVWFYPWDAPELAAYFDADQSRWRLNSRSPITGLRLWATPLDWVSQQPEAITIHAADAVRLTMSP
ncbi:MAG: hypothetical protein WA655_21565 [Candidatus Korobacteraceae bacterium]